MGWPNQEKVRLENQKSTAASNFRRGLAERIYSSDRQGGDLTLKDLIVQDRADDMNKERDVG